MIERLLKLFFRRAARRGRQQYRRILPFGDYVSDRWSKAREIGFGDGSSIYDSALVFDSVNVGRDVWIGPFTLLDGSGGCVTIGDNCHISAGVQIYTHDTVEQVIYAGEIQKADVAIGHHCYIGPNSVISKGVTIGDYVVIGANSFVNRDVPSYSKGFGTPFRITEKVQPPS